MRNFFLILFFSFSFFRLNAQTEIVDIMLFTGEKILGVTLEDKKNDARLKYQNGEEILFDQVGIIEGSIGMILLGGITGDLPITQFLDLTKQSYDQLTKKVYDNIGGKTIESYQVGNVLEKLETKNLLKLKIDLKDIRDVPQNSLGVFLKYSNISMQPEDINGTAFLGFDAGYELWIFPRLVQEDGSRIMLPHIEIGPNLAYAYSEIPSKLVDIALSSSTHLEFHALICRRWPFKEIANCHLNNDFTDEYFMPKNLSAVAEGNGIQLDWDFSFEEVEYFNIYRDVKSMIGNSEGVLIGHTNGTESNYRDENVEAFTRYYYRIEPVNPSLDYLIMSEETTEYYDVEYYYEGLEKAISAQVKARFEVDGVLKSVLSESVEGASVKLEFLNNKLLIAQSVSNQLGDFSFNPYAGVVPGIYPLSVNSFESTNGVSEEISLIINEDENKGHDISIAANGEMRKSYPETETPLLSYQLANNTQFKEEGIVLFKLVRENGTILQSNQTAFTMNGEQNLYGDISFDLSGLENSLCYLFAESLPNLDYIKVNNLLKRPVFVVPESDDICYRLSDYQFNTANGTWARNILGHTFRIIEGKDMSVIFSIDGDTLDLAVDQYYIDDAKSLAVNVRASYSDTISATVAMRIGGRSNDLDLPSFDELEAPGETVKYDITIPSEYDLDDRIEFHISNKNIQSWSQTFNKIEGSDYSRQLSIDIPADESAGDLHTWIQVKTEDGTYWWLKKIYLRIREPFDIGVSSINTENGVDEDDLTICGDVLTFSTTLTNHSVYHEYSQKLNFKVEIEDSLIYSETLDADLNPGESRDFEFILPTLGLESGDYNISIDAPCYYDHNQSNNNHSIVLNLIDPPELIFNLSDLTGRDFLVNEEAVFLIELMANDVLVSEADVLVDLLTPDGFIHTFKCDYYQAENKFGFSFKPTIGGNYIMDIAAGKIRHIGNQVQQDVPVHSYLVLTGEDSFSNVGSVYSLNLSTELVGGLNAIACEVQYDKERFKYKGYTDLGNLTDEETRSQVFVSDEGGNLLIGITRLNKNNGANIYSREGILNLQFDVLQEGSTSFDLFDAHGFSAQEKEFPFIISTSTTVVNVEPNTVYSRMIVERDTFALFDTTSITLTLSNLENVGSVSGSIEYDSSVFKILDIAEGTLLNRYGEEITNAVFNTYKKGQIDFGISRTNQLEGVFDLSGELLKFELISIGSGISSVEISELTVLAPNNIAVYETVLPEAILMVSGSENDSIPIRPEPKILRLKPGQTGILDLLVDSIRNAFAVSGDIYYDNNSVELLNITEGELFNENNTVSTTFITDIDAEYGKVTLGLSRLGPVGNVTTHSERSLFSLEMKGLEPDTFLVHFPNAIFHLENGTMTQAGKLLETKVMVAENFAPYLVAELEDLNYNEGFLMDTIHLSEFYNDVDGDQISYEAYSSDNSVATVSVINQNLIITEGGKGELTIKLIATDDSPANLFATDSFSVRINDINDPPLILNSIPDLSLKEGFVSYTVELSDVFSDPDSETLVITALSEDENIVTVSVEGSALKLLENGLGTSTITVSATDGEFNVSDTFNVLVETVVSSEFTTYQLSDCEVKLYPNPSNGIMWLELPDYSLEPLTIEIVSITGDIIFQSQLNFNEIIYRKEINLGSQLPGMYLMKLSNSEGYRVVKFAIH